MASNRKENLWVTPSKRAYDNYPKSTIRGYSNMGNRAGYSRTKAEEPGFSNASYKKVGSKEDIPREDIASRVPILNDRQNGADYNAYHFMRLKEKEEWAKEQKRQQLERMRLIERVDQSKKDFMEKERFREAELEVRRQKEKEKEREQEEILKGKTNSSIRIPSAKQIPQNSFTSKKAMLVGLNNMGNTCYMNSTLQCLLHIPQFNDYFLNPTFKQELKSTGRVADAYGKLVSLMYNSNSRSETPSYLKQSLGCRFSQFSGYSQQDAQQLLVSLRQSLNNDLSRVDKKKAKYKELTADTKKHSLSEISQEWWSYYKERDDSIIQDFFCGQLMSKVICGKCKNESIAFDNFEDLTLSFQKHETSSDLTKMIEMFLREETLSDSFFCSCCKQLRQSAKKLAIFRLPKVLVIQLKRFSYGKWRKEKITTKINFSKHLDLSSVITESSHSATRSAKYELIGVVNHSGGIDFGHYTADCQDISTGHWYTFNDGSVSESGYNSSHRFSSSSPYLLFYFNKG